MCRDSFRFFIREMEMRRQRIQNKQETHPQQKSRRRRKPQDAAFLFRHINGRDQERPYGSRHHNARSKSQEQLLQPLIHFFFHKKYHRRAKGGPGKWYQYSDQCVLVHIFSPFIRQSYIHYMHSVVGNFSR